MKKKIKFLLRLLATAICACVFCSITEPGSLLFVATLTIAVFAVCAAQAEYEDEKMENLIDKNNNDEAK